MDARQGAATGRRGGAGPGWSRVYHSFRASDLVGACHSWTAHQPYRRHGKSVRTPQVFAAPGRTTDVSASGPRGTPGVPS